MDPQEKPRLRPLLLIRTEMQGKQYVVAQDQSREAQPVALPAELEPILVMLDGNNSLRDIQVDLTRQSGGTLVPIDEVTKIIEELDSHMLLDSPRFRETVALDARFWKQKIIRKPFHAGQAYPSEPDEINELFDGFYSDAPEHDDSSFVRGLLAPHIDIKSGGPTFAAAYNLLKKTPRADLYVLLGTAHNYTPGPLSITRKDYMTPLGVLDTDNDFLDLLLEKFSPEWLTDDNVHRVEHSIEFQTVFLQHLLGAGEVPKVLPILVGGFSEFIGERTSPSKDDEVAGFLEAFQNTVEEDGRKVTYIVGGDLAHIGPRYGDPDPLIRADIEDCMKKDNEMLEAAAEGAERFFDYVARESDKRHICGMPPMYIMLKLIEGSTGKIIKVDHWLDEPTQSAVTFAAMSFN